IVLPDADAGLVVEQLASAAFGSAGERCMAISAAVAVGRTADRLVEALSAKAASIKVGPGRDPQSEMGPLVTRQARERIAGFIGASAQQGARVALDGRQLVVAGYENGFFLGPTVIDQVAPTMDVYREELFGPVLSVLRAQTLDEAIALVNS